MKDIQEIVQENLKLGRELTQKEDQVNVCSFRLMIAFNDTWGYAIVLIECPHLEVTMGNSQLAPESDSSKICFHYSSFQDIYIKWFLKRMQHV
jgi:hypothetical protein